MGKVYSSWLKSRKDFHHGLLAQLPRSEERSAEIPGSYARVASLSAGRPGLHRLHDLLGDLQDAIDLPVHVVRGGRLADLQDAAVDRGQDHGRYLVGRQLLSQRGP